MKKVMAFFSALIVFIALMVTIHFVSHDCIRANDKQFGLWINEKKCISHEAVSNNLHNDTMLLLGSSEFNHGKKTPFHPSAVFSDSDLDVMCVGGIHTQSLFHTLTLAGSGNDLKSKKVLLIVSPTWFYGRAILPEEFIARFPEGQYIKTISSSDISGKTKARIKKRVKKLTSSSAGVKKRVENYNEVMENEMMNNEDTEKKKVSFVKKVFFNIYKGYTQEKELISPAMLWKMHGIRSNKNNKNAIGYNKIDGKKENGTPDWDALLKKARNKQVKEKTNKFHMSPTGYLMIKALPKCGKNINKNLEFEQSVEYDDFRLFLDVSKQLDMKTGVLILPMNGYWYDYSGFNRTKRYEFMKKIKKIVKDYDNVTVINFFDRDYQKGFLEDRVHPDSQGWVEINKAIYEFGKEN